MDHQQFVDQLAASLDSAYPRYECLPYYHERKKDRLIIAFGVVDRLAETWYRAPVEIEVSIELVNMGLIPVVSIAGQLIQAWNNSYESAASDSGITF